MARRNLMFLLAKVAVSLALLSGCILESPDERVGRLRDEMEDDCGDLSVTGKAGLNIHAYVAEGSEIPESEPEDPPKLPPPDPEQVEEQTEEGSGEEPIPVPIDKSPIPKRDPQPDPQVVLIIDAWDPQPEPRLPESGTREDEAREGGTDAD